MSLQEFNRNYGLNIKRADLSPDDKELVDFILGGDDEILIDTLQQYFKTSSSSLKKNMMNYMYGETEEGLVGPVLADL